jgi:hypothetical protein
LSEIGRVFVVVLILIGSGVLIDFWGLVLKHKVSKRGTRERKKSTWSPKAKIRTTRGTKRNFCVLFFWELVSVFI